MSEINWRNLILVPKRGKLCVNCSKQLELINGERCKICSRPSFKTVCSDCKQWQNHLELSGIIDFNYSIYHYNEMMKDLISKWKYRSDYVLGDIFKHLFLQTFNEVFVPVVSDYLVVPIPLSKERKLLRGFNQAEQLASFLPRHSNDIINRIHSEKQSKKSRLERISMENPFIMHKRVNKPIILVDDIYTTGATIYNAGALLKKHGCPKVLAYTLIRG